MNQTNARTLIDDVEQEEKETQALTAEELAFVAGGECVVNQL